jgi:hypothetical protein
MVAVSYDTTTMQLILCRFSLELSSEWFAARSCLLSSHELSSSIFSVILHFLRPFGRLLDGVAAGALCWSL